METDYPPPSNLGNSEEEWRDVSIAIGYRVSNFGRVISRWSVGGANPGSPYLTNKWRLIAGRSAGKGYRSYALKTSSGFVRQYLHRIVITEFHGDPPSLKHEVRHLDGNPKNNCATNLQWSTHRVNMKDTVTHGTARIGEKVPNASMTNSQAIEVCSRYKSGETQSEIASSMKVSRSTIKRILVGEKWNIVTGADTDESLKTTLARSQKKRLIRLDNEEMTISQWARKLSVKSSVITDRINRYGWTIRRAITEPVNTASRKSKFK